MWVLYPICHFRGWCSLPQILMFILNICELYRLYLCQCRRWRRNFFIFVQLFDQLFSDVIFEIPDHLWSVGFIVLSEISQSFVKWTGRLKPLKIVPHASNHHHKEASPNLSPPLKTPRAHWSHKTWGKPFVLPSVSKAPNIILKSSWNHHEMLLFYVFKSTRVKVENLKNQTLHPHPQNPIHLRIPTFPDPHLGFQTQWSFQASQGHVLQRRHRWAIDFRRQIGQVGLAAP